MNLFKNRKIESISKFSTKKVTKKFNTSNETCSISIEDALFGEVEGKEVMLDKALIDSTLDDVMKSFSKNCSKYNPIPKHISISREEKDENSPRDKNEEVPDNDEILSIYEPKWSIEDVYIESDSKKQILTSLSMAKHKDILFKEWGIRGGLGGARSIVMNFWGPPGTGKSMAAEAVAGYLGHNVYCVNYAELESKYVGETPKNIKQAFQRANENNAVLIFDEADSFLGKRLTNVSQSADYGVNITRSVMLMELERFEGVVIFTTNLLKNYDEAFKRRILANIEFKLPDKEGRRKIWEVHIPEKMPIGDSVSYEQLAEKYEGISGADIKDIVLYAAVSSLNRQSSKVEISDFDDAYKYVKSRYNSEIEVDDVKMNTEVISKEQYEREMAEFDKQNNKGI